MTNEDFKSDLYEDEIHGDEDFAYSYCLVREGGVWTVLSYGKHNECTDLNACGESCTSKACVAAFIRQMQSVGFYDNFIAEGLLCELDSVEGQ